MLVVHVIRSPSGFLLYLRDRVNAPNGDDEVAIECDLSSFPYVIVSLTTVAALGSPLGGDERKVPGS